MRATLTALLLAAASAAGAAQFQTVFQGDLEGGVVSVPQDSNNGIYPSLLGDLNLAPALRFEGGGTLNPLLFANGTGQSRPIDEETLYVRSYVLGFRPTYTHPLGWTWAGGGWSAGVRALATHAWNQEAFGEALGKGLYDYEEFGAGLLLKRDAGSMDSQLSLDVSHRDYPNYHGLNPAATDFKDYYLKDSVFWRLGLRHKDRVSDSLVASADLRASERYYTDSYVDVLDTADGISATKQMDLNVNVDLGLAWRLDPAWSLDLGVGGDLLSSNQNILDTTSQAQAVFTAHGDDFEDLRLDPGAHWVRGRFSAGATYELLLRSTGHRIQDPDGAYAQGDQADVEHGITLNAVWDLGRGLKVRADLAARDVLSNQEFAHGGALAAYSYYNGGLGLAYEWESAKL